MRKRPLIALIFLVVGLCVLAFVYSPYPNRIAASAIRDRLTRLPLPVRFELRRLSLLPPWIDFTFVQAGNAPTPILGLTGCRLTGLGDLVFKRSPGPCMECNAGTLRMNRLLGLFGDKGPGRPGSTERAGSLVPNLRLLVRKLTVPYGKRPVTVQFDGVYEDQRLSARIGNSAQPKSPPFCLIRAHTGTGTVDLHLRDARLKGLLHPFLPPGVLKGTCRGRLVLRIGGDRRARIRANLRFPELLLSHRFVHTTPLNLLPLRVQGRATLDPAEQTLHLSPVRLRMGNITILLSGRVSETQFELTLRAKPMALNDMARLVGGPLFDGFSMTGSVQAELRLSGERSPTPRVSKILLTGSMKDVGQLSQRLAFLKTRFLLRPPDRASEPAGLVPGPRDPEYVALRDLPQHLSRTVVLTEDGAFFSHQGIDFKEMNAALEAFAETGKIRGASTITQQLARNLFLTKDRTLMRKLKEVVLALELDAALSKDRILEIYLNLIEWGPGIFGIGRAARHYFGKAASELTPLEAAYLVSIIPNPRRFHVHYQKGEVHPNWRMRVDQVLRLMHERGVISLEVLNGSLAQDIGFHKETG
jgi:hypothetical protein